MDQISFSFSEQELTVSASAEEQERLAAENAYLRNRVVQLRAIINRMGENSREVPEVLDDPEA